MTVSSPTSSPTHDAPATARARPSWPFVAATLAGPALLAIVGVVSPIDDADEPADRLADIYAHQGRYSLTLVLLVAALLLLARAALVVRDAAPPEARRAATVGATIAAVGFLLFTVATGALGFAPASWASLPESERGDLLAAFVAMDEGKGPMGPVLVAPLLAVVGLAILAVTLWRRTDQSRAGLAALPVGWAVFLFAPANPIESAGALIVLAGLALLVRTPAVTVSPRARG